MKNERSGQQDDGSGDGLGVCLSIAWCRIQVNSRNSLNQLPSHILSFPVGIQSNVWSPYFCRIYRLDSHGPSPYPLNATFFLILRRKWKTITKAAGYWRKTTREFGKRARRTNRIFAHRYCGCSASTWAGSLVGGCCLYMEYINPLKSFPWSPGPSQRSSCSGSTESVCFVCEWGLGGRQMNRRTDYGRRSTEHRAQSLASVATRCNGKSGRSVVVQWRAREFVSWTFWRSRWQRATTWIFIWAKTMASGSLGLWGGCWGTREGEVVVRAEKEEVKKPPRDTA